MTFKLINRQVSQSAHKEASHRLGKLALAVLSLVCIFGLEAASKSDAFEQADSKSLKGTADSLPARDQIWFSPESHYPPRPESDFLELFADDSPWQKAASHIGVVKLSTQFFLNAPPAVVKQAVVALRTRNIGLAIEAQVQCRSGAAGSRSEDLAEKVIYKLQSAGAQLQAVSADGSLFALLSPSGSGGCGDDVETAAGHVAAVLQIYKNAFPAALLGDIEPLPLLLQKADWRERLIRFYAALKSCGFAYRFVDIDVNWRDPGVTAGNIHVSDPAKITAAVQAFAEVAHSSGLQLGAIINGKADAKSDLEWTNQATENAGYLNDSAHLDRLVFQSWHTHPFKALPESESGSFTHMIDNYIASHAN